MISSCCGIITLPDVYQIVYRVYDMYGKCTDNKTQPFRIDVEIVPEVWMRHDHKRLHDVAWWRTNGVYKRKDRYQSQNKNRSYNDILLCYHRYF